MVGLGSQSMGWETAMAYQIRVGCDLVVYDDYQVGEARHCPATSVEDGMGTVQ